MASRRQVRAEGGFKDESELTVFPKLRGESWGYRSESGSLQVPRKAGRAGAAGADKLTGQGGGGDGVGELVARVLPKEGGRSRGDLK